MVTLHKRPQMDPATELNILLWYYTGEKNIILSDADNQLQYIESRDKLEAPHMLPGDVEYMKSQGWQYDYTKEGRRWIKYFWPNGEKRFQ